MELREILASALTAAGVLFLLAVDQAHASAAPPISVPEPASLVLLTVGAAGLAWWVRRR